MSKIILRGPLQCWDIYSVFLQKQSEDFKRNSDIAALKEFQDKYNWSFNIEEQLNKVNFDAIVLTNSNQKIEWVNVGFKEMTGYPVNFTKGKSPNFLQGEKTSEETLNRIRENIKNQLPFKETIINYKKSGEMYRCEIEVFPLKNKEGKLSHLLALEKEVYIKSNNSSVLEY
ncbi:PAS domain-containing protein [Lacinutrix mariniflava]|uniref:PAS domain-containing protein n=1 Tax=Lacinutrix mariniflava TaxID=342955 RepID=UPI0006E16429|nr:PAS domain-containing protein [Lacinutrix mariniflava]